MRTQLRPLAGLRFGETPTTLPSESIFKMRLARGSAI